MVASLLFKAGFCFANVGMPQFKLVIALTWYPLASMFSNTSTSDWYTCCLADNCFMFT